MSAQQSLFFLMWECGESATFDVVMGYDHTMPSCHDLNFAWGEHCFGITSSHN
jgi:hypothetical protein